LDQIEQLDQSISSLLRVLTIDERRFSSNLGSLPFNPIDLETLSYLHRLPGSPAKDVATYLGVSSTTMQSVVDRLQKRGFLKRDKAALKGRAIALSLTTEGLMFRQKMHAQNLENCRQMLATLDEPERHAFVRNIAAIAAAFS
jgi:DNA-binding MarR family transcriptional regulator